MTVTAACRRAIEVRTNGLKAGSCVRQLGLNFHHGQIGACEKTQMFGCNACASRPSSACWPAFFHFTSLLWAPRLQDPTPSTPRGTIGPFRLLTLVAWSKNKQECKQVQYEQSHVFFDTTLFRVLCFGSVRISKNILLGAD